MLANLMPPLLDRADAAARVQSAEVAARPAAPARGFVVPHPRYRAWLAKCGLDTADAILNLRGEIVGGHPDRHVVRVELKAGAGKRVVYLKREHRVARRVRLKNAVAGFGFVSRAGREAAILRRLEEAGLPGPHWLAHGEDGAGRAFLLLDDLGAAELRPYLADSRLSPADRRTLAERLGREAAELHEAGFSTPDLSAKHVFVHPRSGAVTVIDWPSATVRPAVAPPARLRSLAALHASLSETLASPRERLRFLWAYLRVVRRCRRTNPGGLPVPRFGAFARTIRAEAKAIGSRPSLRDQRQPAAVTTQRLVWLAGEAVCAVPEIAAGWPTPAACSPFYPAAGEVAPATDRRPMRLADGRAADLFRFRTRDPLGRLRAFLRGKPWRSPAAKLARLLFHLERYGVEAPRLLAFGQRATDRTTADSFVACDEFGASAALPSALADPDRPPAARRLVLEQLGAVLRGLHDSGCRAAGGVPFRVRGRVVFADPTAGVERCRALTDDRKRAELRRLIAALGLGRTDRLRVVRGYFRAEAGRRPAWREAIRSILRSRGLR